MKSASPQLAALILSDSFVTFDIYDFTLPDASVLRLTSAPFDIYDGTTLYNSGLVGTEFPRIDSSSSRASASLKSGLDPNTWQVQVMPQITDVFTGAYTYPNTVGGMPWITACRSAVFDGAKVTVKRAYFPPNQFYPMSVANTTCVGSTVEFIGYVSEIEIDNYSTNFNITEIVGLLSQSLPRNVYQASCRHTLFDAQCTLISSAYGVSGIAASGSGQRTLISAIAAPAGSGTYTLGKVEFTSGANNGVKRVVNLWDQPSNSFQLFYPLPFPIVTGDTFIAYPGCNKKLDVGGCVSFGNQLNFSGEPYIPLPEITLG